MLVLNLTQHEATPDQKADGLMDCIHADDRMLIHRLLTFDHLPGRREIISRAGDLAALARMHKTDAAMLGGPPYLTSVLEFMLSHMGIEPVYSFTQRVSAEQKQADGSVTKTSVFRHLGWVRPYRFEGLIGINA